MKRKQEKLHPQTGEPTNEARAERVAAFIAAYRREHLPDEDVSTVLSDFVTDVCHWAAKHAPDVDMGASLLNSESMCREETLMELVTESEELVAEFRSLRGKQVVRH